MMRYYDEIEIMDRVSIREYLRLLCRKSEMERELKRREELPEGTVYCSFCGKSTDEVKKMIAGPANAFICDECTTICAEILDEELEKEAKEHNEKE